MSLIHVRLRTLSLCKDTSYKIRSVLIVAWGTNQLGPSSPPAAKRPRHPNQWRILWHVAQRLAWLTFTNFIRTNSRRSFIVVCMYVWYWLDRLLYWSIVKGNKISDHQDTQYMSSLDNWFEQGYCVFCIFN